MYTWIVQTQPHIQPAHLQTASIGEPRRSDQAEKPETKAQTLQDSFRKPINLHNLFLSFVKTDHLRFYRDYTYKEQFLVD